MYSVQCDVCVCGIAAVQCGGGYRGDWEAAATEGRPQEALHHHPSQQDLLSLHLSIHSQEGTERGEPYLTHLHATSNPD